MNELEQGVKDLLAIFFDPNAKQVDLDAALTKANQELVDMKGINKEGLPKNKTAACLYLATQNMDTSAKDLSYLIDKYYRSVEVAKLVARHPSLPIHLLAKMSHFLPEDVAANPNYNKYSQNEKWDGLLANKPISAKSRYKYYGGSSFDFYVVEDRPDYYKINYWLKKGKASDRIHLASMDRINEDLVISYTNDTSAHVRKALANRKQISAALSEALVNDKAKTVRQALANNPTCSPDVLTQLTQDSESIVKSAALANKSCPIDAIHAAKLAEQVKPKPVVKSIDKLNEQEIISRLADETLDVNQLNAFSKMELPFVRAAVALHVGCEEKTLKVLAKDTDDMVRLSAAYNPKTPTSSLQHLLKSKNSFLYSGLAANPGMNEKQQLALIKVADEACLLTLANTTESELVWQELRDSEPVTKQTEKAKSKKKTWRECLAICLDPKGKGLYALQRNRHTRHLFVNKLVARHPKCTPSLKPHYAFYLLESLMKNPQMALTMLENPNAVKPVEYAEWKLKDWFMYENAPGHVVKYYLDSDEIKYARKAVLCWTAQLADIQAQIYVEDIHMKKYMAGMQNATQFMFEILARDVKESVRMAVVDNKKCPPQVLAHLVKDKVAGIRIGAQNHPNFDAKLASLNGGKVVIESLKNKGPKRIRIKQARDTESLTVLRDLAGDKVKDVRLTVINNSKTPVDVLEILKNDPDEEIRRLSCYHSNSSVGICRDLFKDPKEKVRHRALSSYLNATAKKLDKKDTYNRKYDEATLQLFYHDEGESVRALVASKTCSIDIQKQYAKDSSELVRNGLTYNFQLDQDVALELIKSNDKKVIRNLAQYTPNKKVFFATLPHGESVASSLWRNRSMRDSLEVQQVLVAHESPKVRVVAADYSTDHEVLKLCVQDNDKDVLSHVAYNESLTADHIKLLLNKATADVMSGLYSSHERYLKKHVSECAEHPNEHVRAYVAETLKLTQAIIKTLVRDKAAVVRKGLLENYEAKLSEEMIELLRNDENEHVRRAVKWRYD